MTADPPEERGRDGAGEGGPGESWTVLRMVRWSADYLSGKGVEASQARLDAEHLLAHALDTGRLQLYLDFARPLTPAELERYRPLLLRRARREPLQYVLGRGAFRELDLRVDRRVLIPRPETEELVEAVLEWARERAGVAETASPGGRRAPLPWSDAGGGEGGDRGDSGDGVPEGAVGADGGRQAPRARSLTALDVGTGSGCIALSLALEGPFARVVATDPSRDALEVAAGNARETGLDHLVELRAGRLFEAVEGEAFDAVVSNPPYVARGEAGELAAEVRDWEPDAALFAGADGLEVALPLVEGAGRHLVDGGLLALEVGPGQAEQIAEAVARTGAFGEPTVRRDLAGRPRFVLAVRRPD